MGTRLGAVVIGQELRLEEGSRRLVQGEQPEFARGIRQTRLGGKEGWTRVGAGVWTQGAWTGKVE
jgi:hypothetical protein